MMRKPGANVMLKTVGASGQLSLGKQLAGQHYEMQRRADGTILLVPVTVSRAAAAPRTGRQPGRARPAFHVFKVDHFDLPSRDELHRRGRVR